MIIESLAAIDVGSNTVRLLITNVEDYHTRQTLKKNAYLRVPVRLGEEVFTIGQISSGKLENLGETLDAFKKLMKVFGTSRYRACATSALREATNQAQVITLVQERTGIILEVISGDEEAELVFAAGNLSKVMDETLASYLHVDVGGGSTEVIIYHQGQKRACFSFPLGTLRLLAGQVPRPHLKEFEAKISALNESYGPLKIIASGGNINKTLKLLGNNDGDRVSFAALHRLYTELSSMSFEERLAHYELNSYRADVIGPALSIFLTVGRITKAESCVIPKVGLVDGIIHLMQSGARPGHLTAEL